MKKLIFSIAALILTQTASAGVLSVPLLIKHVDPKSDLQGVIESVELRLDEDNGLIEMNLDRAVIYTCMAIGCPPAPPAGLLNIRLPLTEVATGSCRSTVYRGSQVLKGWEPARREIEVIDNRTNACLYLLPIPTFEVRYKYESESSGETLSIFVSDKID